MEPIVSIVCNTYNHELYIREALEGFLKQKTEFSYEILIYDDASTDKTVEIIREYEIKYPNIIKPVYQTVNQYSQGLKPGKQNRDRAKGKYVAICEGDDYWIDENKLNEQIEYMEKHPKCTFCFTNGITRFGNEFKKKIIPWNKSAIVPKGKKDYNVGEVNLMDYIPTASFVYRNGYTIPELNDNAFTGDLYIESIMTNYGYAHFIDKNMVVYRRNVQNSVTSKWKNKKTYYKQCERFIEMFQELKILCDHKYDDVFNARICQRKIEKNMCINDKQALKKIYKSGEIKTLKALSVIDRVKYNFICRFYVLYYLLKMLKKRIKNG